MTTLLQLGVSIETAKYKIHVSKSKLAVKNVTGVASPEKEVQLDGDGCYGGLSDYECQPCPRAIPPGTSLRGLGRGDEETADTSDYYELRIFFQKILEILIDTRELDTAVNLVLFFNGVPRL